MSDFAGVAGWVGSRCGSFAGCSESTVVGGLEASAFEPPFDSATSRSDEDDSDSARDRLAMLIVVWVH